MHIHRATAVAPRAWRRAYATRSGIKRLAPRVRSSARPNTPALGRCGRSTEHATLLTHKGALEAAPEESQRVLKEMFAFWDNVNSEDIDICEKVQVGTGERVMEMARRDICVRQQGAPTTSRAGVIRLRGRGSKSLE